MDARFTEDYPFGDGSQRPLRPCTRSCRAAGEPFQQVSTSGRWPSWRQSPNRQAVVAAQVRRGLREDLKAVEVRAAVLLVYGYFVVYMPFDELFMIVVGLAVAAVPEGLPAVLAITLAVGLKL